MGRDDTYDEVHRDTGRKGYLEPDEQLDGQHPRLKVAPFWESASEELEYLHAVEETRGMLPSERLEAIRKKFGKGGAVKAMPRVRKSGYQTDQRLAELRQQIARDRVIGEKA